MKIGLIDVDRHVLVTYKASAGRKSVDNKKLAAEYAGKQFIEEYYQLNVGL